MPNLQYEHSYKEQVVAGLDEVGRGCLAGPVVTAAVILPEYVILPGVDDSKKISKNHHRKLVDLIIDRDVEVSVGVATPQEIDTLNILQATKLAMKRAIKNLTIKPQVLLIDGGNSQHLDGLSQVQECIPQGDSKSLSIASASLVAKLVRDQMMKQYHQQYPEYQWDTNSGYGTQYHRDQLAAIGYTPFHRLSFEPLKSHMDDYIKRS